MKLSILCKGRELDRYNPRTTPCFLRDMCSPSLARPPRGVGILVKAAWMSNRSRWGGGGMRSGSERRQQQRNYRPFCNDKPSGINLRSTPFTKSSTCRPRSGQSGGIAFRMERARRPPCDRLIWVMLPTASTGPPVSAGNCFEMPLLAGGDLTINLG